MGKGSAPRPMEIDRDQYANRHEAIFGKRDRPRYVPPPLPGAGAMDQHQAAMRSVTSWPDKSVNK